MKILRYLIFLSILSGIFFVIYRQSDENGFRRWWISFKIAVLIAASAAGLVSESALAKEFNQFQGTDQQVILVGRDSSGTSSNVPSNIGRQGQSPSNFPTPPAPAGLAAAPNPGSTTLGAVRYFGTYTGRLGRPPAGGVGGNAEFDDQCPVPKNQQSQESKTFDYDYCSNDPKKKKQSAEQCELDAKIEIVYRIKENPALVREAERMGKDQAAQKDVNNLIEQLSLGNDNPGIGNRRVKGLKNVSEARGRNEGRVYFREKDGKIEILAKSNKDNQKKVLAIFQKMGY